MRKWYWLFFAPAFLCLILYLSYNKVKIDVLAMKKYKKILLSMFTFLGFLLLSALIANSEGSLKLARANFERIFPFLFIIFGLAGEKNIRDKMKYIIVGISTGIFIICFSVLNNIFLEGLYRPTSLLGSVNILGGTLILIFPVLVALINFCNESKEVNIFALLSISILLITLFVIKSRGSWFGFGIMVAILPFLLFKIKKISFSKVCYIELGLLILAGGIYFVFYDLLHRSYDFVRPALREIAWNIFIANPIAGIGAENFISTYTDGRYISPLVDAKGVWKHAHNIYFKFLSENGLLGFGGFISLIIFQLHLLWKSIAKQKNILSIGMFLAIMGMLAHGWFDVCFSARYYAMTYWLLFGIVCYYILNETEDLSCK